MEKYTNTLLVDQSGGVQRSVGRLLMASDESYVIQNGELYHKGSIRKVKGYTQRGADVNAGYKILGGFGAYKPSTETLKQFVVCDNASDSDCYTFNPITNVWTPHLLSLTSGKKAEFEPFLDGVFMVNGSNATRWNDLTQWYTTTNVTSAPVARYVKQYLSRLYLFYVTYDASTYMSRCVFSDLPTGSPMTIAWNNAENYFDVDSDDGDVGTALEVNANRLLLFKENSLHRYDTNSRYKVPGCPGTVSQRSVKNIGGYTLYYHSSGIWGYDGTSSKLLSGKVQEIVEGVKATNLANICAWATNENYYLFLGDIENLNTGLTIDKCLIDYDLGKDAFTWRSLADEPTVFFDYRNDTSLITYDDATVTYNDANTTYNATATGSNRVYFGNMVGQVFEFEEGKSFNSTDIEFVVETRDMYFGDPTAFKLFQKVFILHDKGTGLIVSYKVDDTDWKTLGRVSQNNSELIFPSATRGRRIRFRLSEISSGDQFEFEGLDIYYTIEGTLE